MTILWKDITVPVDTDPVELGPSALLDEGVILGYPTGRTIEDRILRIGCKARIRSGTIIYGGSIIGDELETGHGAIIREESSIGSRLMVWSNSVIDYGCKIGDDVRIHTNVYLAQFTEVGDHVFLAPGVTTTNDPHPICADCMQGPTIEAWARIGANSTILPRIRIGKRSLVGAGSVVSKDVPPEAVVMGNPARVVGNVRDVKCKWGDKEFAYPDLRGNE